MTICDDLFGQGIWFWARYGTWIISEGFLAPYQIYGKMRAVTSLQPNSNNSYYQGINLDNFCGGMKKKSGYQFVYVHLPIFLDIYPTDLKKWEASEDPLGGIFLFDIKNDPSESNNLASQHPDLVVRLLKEAEEEIRNAPPQEFGFVSFLLSYFELTYSR